MQTFPSVQEHLCTYVDAGFPIIYIYTSEESVADSEIEKLKELIGNRKIIEWNNARGFVKFDTKIPYIQNCDIELEEILTKFATDKMYEQHILVIKDAAEKLKSDKVIALLKEIARRICYGIEQVVIIVSSSLCIPKELEKQITVLEITRPNEDKIKEIVEKLIDSENFPTSFINRIVTSLKGLYESEIESIFNLAYAQDGEITEKSLSLINLQKQQMILKSGILEMIPLSEDINDIGGLENLKEWLKKKAEIFNNIAEAKEFGVPIPKGVMIAGVAGCGKSLSAKAAGKLFDMPLLRMDMGKLMGKYVGESEENMRKAISLAEAMAPSVLWIDELEKAFAGIGNGNGSEVTTRLFGAFLTWMQEKKAPVFVIATANEIKGLPPELLRKGRFDEIFYVSLPNDDERRKIFEIHIKKRRKKNASSIGIDIEKLVDNTYGYSGADIESIVGESIEAAFINKSKEITTEDLIACISSTKSLSEIMGEQLKSLINFYEEKDFRRASKD